MGDVFTAAPCTSAISPLARQSVLTYRPAHRKWRRTNKFANGAACNYVGAERCSITGPARLNGCLADNLGNPREFSPKVAQLTEDRQAGTARTPGTHRHHHAYDRCLRAPVVEQCFRFLLHAHH